MGTPATEGEDTAEADQVAEVREHSSSEVPLARSKRSVMWVVAVIVVIVFLIMVPGLILGLVTRQVACAIAISGAIAPAVASLVDSLSSQQVGLMSLVGSEAGFCWLDFGRPSVVEAGDDAWSPSYAHLPWSVSLLF